MRGESSSSTGAEPAGPWRSAERHRWGQDAPPLAGVRVLDLATALAAPLAAGILAEQGADVIKIEPPGAGDVLRHVGPAIGGVSGIYQMTNRSKRAATVDITTAEGRAIVLELAAGADLVLQNFRPGVAERLGVSYEHLRQVNPDVIVVAVTGFGPTGPYADRPAYDGIIQAASGFAALEADAETGEPHSLRHTVSDKLTALYAVQAATAALLARERGAGGQLLEIAMLEVSASFLWIDAAGRETLLDYDGPQRSDPAAHVKPMACADGWMYIVALSDDQYTGLCRALEVEVDERLATMAGRHQNRGLARLVWREIRARLAALGTAEACARLEAHDVPHSPAVAVGDLPAHPQLSRRDFFGDSVHPAAGRMRQTRPPVRFSGTPAVWQPHAPEPGRDTDEIIAGLGGADAGALRAAGVIS
ncbi:MAG: CoA transferase [bacterium]|nr:CoA transferase [bacterium]